MAKPIPFRNDAGTAAASRTRVAALATFSGDAVVLVRGLRSQDPAAKAAFFERYAGRVERIVTRVLGFDAELADVIQEVFVNALSSLHTLKDASLLDHWLSRVAALTARKVLRTRSRRRWLRVFTDASEEEQHEPLGTTPDVEGRRALAAVYAVLGRLPADERIALALRLIEGMELTEIAATTGVSLSTVKRRLARAERRFITHARTYTVLEPWIRGATDDV